MKKWQVDELGRAVTDLHEKIKTAQAPGKPHIRKKLPMNSMIAESRRGRFRGSRSRQAALAGEGGQQT